MQILRHPHLLFNLQNKRLIKMRRSNRAPVKINFSRAVIPATRLNYVDYPFFVRRVLKIIFRAGIFFGLGVHSFYSSDILKKQKLSNINLY